MRLWCAITSASVLSYGAVFVHADGFDAVLAVHVVVAVAAALRVLRRCGGDAGVRAAFAYAVLSCAAFIILKVHLHVLCVQC